MPKPTVAVVGASNDRRKFGNKSLRAHLRRGYEVFPVNPNETTVEGIPAYKSVRDLPVRPNRVTLYVPPEIGTSLLADVAQRGTDELWINPGAESEELVDEAKRLGLNPILACSIVELGEMPDAY
jgi:hypothetical protein